MSLKLWTIQMDARRPVSDLFVQVDKTDWNARLVACVYCIAAIQAMPVDFFKPTLSIHASREWQLY